MARSTALDPGEVFLADDDVVAGSEGAAVAVIDDALISFVGRALVSGSEVVDRLLDLRSAFIAATALRELEVAAAADAHPSNPPQSARMCVTSQP